MNEFIIYDGIVQIGFNDAIIGIFDIRNYKYYSFNAFTLGKYIWLYIQPVCPEPAKWPECSVIEYLRRNRAYEVKIRYKNIGPAIYDITRIYYDNDLNWPSSIEILDIWNNSGYYHWDECIRTWLFSTDIRRYQTIKTAWGPHTIEIKEMKKENTTMNAMDRLAYNYCASDAIATAELYKHFANSFYGLKPKNKYLPEIKNVVISDPYTTILWSDGSKTQVKCMEGDTFDPEHGFAMAVLKKLMEKPDKPNAYSKWVKQWTEKGLEAGEKQAARKNKKAEKKAEKETCDACSWTFDKDENVQTGPIDIDYSNT